MDAKTKKIFSTWGIAAGIFLISAIISVGFMFAPVKVHSTDIYNQETVSSGSIFSDDGASLIAQSWKQYPAYNIGLGISAFMAFSGAVFCIFNMHKANQE